MSLSWYEYYSGIAHSVYGSLCSLYTNLSLLAFRCEMPWITLGEKISGFPNPTMLKNICPVSCGICIPGIMGGERVGYNNIIICPVSLCPVMTVNSEILDYPSLLGRALSVTLSVQHCLRQRVRLTPHDTQGTTA